MKFCIVTRQAIGFNNELRQVFLRWENKRPSETWFKSFRRIYGSRGEAKRDLKRAKKFGLFENAKVEISIRSW